ncbi:alanine racemase-like [Physella acuta]|uniref:alanine racemase-like n=1 Tax=Physella acuta TaxID=109671 RepID=UPI0027DB3B84|nr:alanine racemase-like [Physella acuta]XP_059145160.1 alanine racemase-like [Physella acuta]XP_059145161.1 alanine racemase-like [Physella acuta]XP_059145162.1 alanine racemase-like [Physella acuta]XP_059145163.1 alanine racemase-like [Physella acuta]XP_059145164.1 alanine racemase-like [Physella acuta]XP_059145165.1 alanine racemase-like [Physella acuta]
MIKSKVKEVTDFSKAGRSTFIRVELDAIVNNINILKSKCEDHTQIMAVLKGNAYGHGAVTVAKHLNYIGLEHFAVATSLEGQELRSNYITGFIQVLGSCAEEEIDTMLQYDLTPTASTESFIKKLAERAAVIEPCLSVAGSEDEIRSTGFSSPGSQSPGCQSPGCLTPRQHYPGRLSPGRHSSDPHFSERHSKGRYSPEGYSQGRHSPIRHSPESHSPSSFGSCKVVRTRKNVSVVIKVDTGMSRNGCQVEDLPNLIETCKKEGVTVHSIMTHFAQAWDDPEFTALQLQTFLTATKQYKDKGIKLHAANSAAIIRGIATDLDFVRPGIAMYGLPLDSSPETAQSYQELGLQPALSWVARPVLIKHLEAGRKVGYDQTYVIPEVAQRIATFSFGYADGYNRLLSSQGVLVDMKGHEYSVVGRVSMDAVTVNVDEKVDESTIFYVIKNDYSAPNSAGNMAAMLNTIPYEVATSLAHRLPRLYYLKKMYVFREE